MRNLAAFCLLAALAAAAGPAAAQDDGKPLADVLDALPPPEGERPEPVKPAPAPAPPVPRGVGTTELPPSRATGLVAEPRDDAAPASAAAVPDAQAEAEAAWAAEQERRRAEINAVEGPMVEALNAAMAARQEEATRRIERDLAEHRRRVAEHERRVAEIEAERLRLEAEHRAAVERHRREVERQRAQYQACLDGDRSACPPR